MNLYKYLYNNKELQIKFCESLMNDIPELVEYSMNNYNYINTFGIWTGSNGYNRIHVGVCRKNEGSSFYNIFDVVDRPIDDWHDWNSKHIVLYDMCYNKEKKLAPIVKDWLITYEKNILRYLKINKIRSKK